MTTEILVDEKHSLPLEFTPASYLRVFCFARERDEILGNIPFHLRPHGIAYVRADQSVDLLITDALYDSIPVTLEFKSALKQCGHRLNRLFTCHPDKLLALYSLAASRIATKHSIQKTILQADPILLELLRKMMRLGATDIEIDVDTRLQKTLIYMNIHSQRALVESYDDVRGLDTMRAVQKRFENDPRMPSIAPFSELASISGRMRVKEVSGLAMRVQTLTKAPYGVGMALRRSEWDGMWDLFQNSVMIGWHPDQSAQFQEALNARSGMVVLVGRTGAGKSMSMLTALKVSFEKRSWRVVSIEDPQEVYLEGLFPVTLYRSDVATGVYKSERDSYDVVMEDLMRYLPGGIFVGEIRNQKAGSLALAATLSGHITMGTFHAADEITALQGLTNPARVNLDPDTLFGPGGLLLVASTQLVPTLCSCAQPFDRSNHVVMGWLDVRQAERVDRLFKTVGSKGGWRIRNPDGCDLCNHGYPGTSGTTATVGILEMTPQVKEAAIAKDFAKVARVALAPLPINPEDPIPSMHGRRRQEHLLYKVRLGQVCITEALRELPELTAIYQAFSKPHEPFPAP